MITSSLSNYFIELDNAEAMINEAIKPALKIYKQSETSLRIMNLTDVKLFRFRELTDFDHLRVRYSDHDDSVDLVTKRRGAIRKRLVAIGVNQSEVTKAGYSTFNGGEVYAFVLPTKKLEGKDRVTARTDVEDEAVKFVVAAGKLAKELQSMLEAGQLDRAQEKRTEVIAAMSKANVVMQSDAFKTAQMKKQIADNGGEYVYFIVNEQRQGQRALSTVYEAQIPPSGGEFLAYKVTIGTKKH